jgi:hypothetical protein
VSGFGPGHSNTPVILFFIAPVFQEASSYGLGPNWNVGMLEYWNTGMLVFGFYRAVILVKSASALKFKIDMILKKPLFHYSSIPLLGL